MILAMTVRFQKNWPRRHIKFAVPFTDAFYGWIMQPAVHISPERKSPGGITLNANGFIGAVEIVFMDHR